MNNIAKLIIASMLILLVISASGCQNTSDDSPADDTYQTRLMSVESFIDPQLENISVTCDNPDIKIISYKLIDERNLEEELNGSIRDLNWSIQAVYENTGDSPLWVIDKYKFITESSSGIIYESSRPGEPQYSIIKSGERGEFIHGGNKLELQNYQETNAQLRYYKGMIIEAHDSVTSDASSE